MGYIFLYTGEGAGKTTNALGLVVRMLGHNKKVLMIQFLKWSKKTGEYLFQFNKGVRGNLEVYQFGREGWHGFENIKPEDRTNAVTALQFIESKLQETKYDLVVLDEVNLAVHLKLITDDECLEVLDKMPKETTVVMTGRHATSALRKRADVVNEVVEAKVPLDGVKCQEGIQY